MWGNMSGLREVGTETGMAWGRNKDVLLCILVASCCAVAALLGWTTGIHWLADFGRPGHPTQSITAWSYLLLSLALTAGLAERRWVLLTLIAPPVLIAASILIGHATELKPLPWGMTLLGAEAPELPTVAAAIEILLLAGGIASSDPGHRKRGQLTVLLASLALAIGVSSIAAIAFVGVGDPMLRYFVKALPTAIASVALSIALLIRCKEAGWPAILAAGGIEGTIARAVLPLAVLTPIVTRILENLIVEEGVLPPALASIADMVVNALVVAALLLWATSRVTREYRVRRALTRALDVSPIALTSLSGKILHWSKGCEQLYGWSADQARGRFKYDLLATETRNGPRSLAERVDQGSSWEEELIERRQDGSEMNVLERAQLLEPKFGGEAVLVLSMTDITDRTKAETALRESEARLTLAIEAHEIGVVEYNHKTGEIQCPPEVERRLGLAPGTIKDVDSWLACVEPADRKLAFQNFYSAAAKRRPRSQFHYRIGPEGDRRTVEGSVSWIYDRKGNLERMVAVGMDVTERTQSEARISDLHAELMHVSRLSAMGEMAAGLAHELNQPLTAIVNFLGAAGHYLDKAEPTQARDLFRMASAEALRAGEIIRRLRSFVSNHATNVQEEPVQEVVEEAVALALAGSSQRDVNVVVTVDEDAHTMLADRVHIQQVLVNLVRNAVEALRQCPSEQPKILIRAGRISEMVEISVEDNGPGLSEKIIGRLYEPFVSTKDDGMGVGLFICRRIIEGHGGELHAANNSAGGATFRFTVRSFEAARGSTLEYA